MPAPLLDRTLLEKLERLTIHWQNSFSGLVGGHRTSRFAGAGLEFLDHRNFHHGDDLRAINWRAYLRLEKLFLKMFQVEPRVPLRLLLDTSLSMTAVSGEKFSYARRLAAALCYVGLVRLDNISVHPFSAELGQRFVCGGGRHRFSPAMDFLTALAPKGRTDYLEVSRQFLSSYAQRGLIIVISDFLDDDGCEKPLQYLADYGHELLLVQVFSEDDRTPPWTGELELTDSETASQLRIYFDEAARERYTTAFDGHSESLQRLAYRNSGRYVGVSTAMPLEEVIFGPLVRAKGVV
ncbi:MAG: DUF58 domain-containing protein [Bryobacteraceae bacterium]